MIPLKEKEINGIPIELKLDFYQQTLNLDIFIGNLLGCIKKSL